MLKHRFTAALLGAALLAGLGGAARADDGIPLRITNNTTDDLIVTVYDLSTRPASAVLSSTRLSSFSSVPVTLAPDSQGRADLSWTAISADPNSRRCGHARRLGLRDDTSVHVRANRSCNPQ